MTPVIRMFAERSMMCRSACANETRQSMLKKLPNLFESIYGPLDTLHDEISDDAIQYKQVMAENGNKSSEESRRRQEDFGKSLKQCTWDEQFLAEDLLCLADTRRKLQQIAGRIIVLDHSTPTKDSKLKLQEKASKRVSESKSVLKEITHQIKRLEGLEIATTKLIENLTTFVLALPETPDGLTESEINKQTAQMVAGRQELARQKHELNLVPTRLVAWKEIQALAESVLNCAAGAQSRIQKAKL